MDDEVLKRLAIAVREARGERSQRAFSQLMQVSQSTVQQWENGKNIPSLENLEKIARMKGMLVEDFVAYLYGRTGGIKSKDILDRIEVMPSEDFGQILHIIGNRLAPPKAAQEGVEKQADKKGSKARNSKGGLPLPLVLERQREVVEDEGIKG